jgi:hypothetical protein
MVAFDRFPDSPPAHQPFPPAWRMRCRCSVRPGAPGEVAACECGYWWRVGRRGRWQAVSARRAFRVLLPGLLRELGRFELTGGWPGSLPALQSLGPVCNIW